MSSAADGALSSQPVQPFVLDPPPTIGSLPTTTVVYILLGLGGGLPFLFLILVAVIIQCRKRRQTAKRQPPDNAAYHNGNVKHPVPKHDSGAVGYGVNVKKKRNGLLSTIAEEEWGYDGPAAGMDWSDNNRNDPYWIELSGARKMSVDDGNDTRVRGVQSAANSNVYFRHTNDDAKGYAVEPDLKTGENRSAAKSNGIILKSQTAVVPQSIMAPSHVGISRDNKIVTSGASHDQNGGVAASKSTVSRAKFIDVATQATPDDISNNTENKTTDIKKISDQTYLVNMSVMSNNDIDNALSSTYKNTGYNTIANGNNTKNNNINSNNNQMHKHTTNTQNNTNSMSNSSSTDHSKVAETKEVSKATVADDKISQAQDGWTWSGKSGNSKNAARAGKSTKAGGQTNSADDLKRYYLLLKQAGDNEDDDDEDDAVTKTTVTSNVTNQVKENAGNGGKREHYYESFNQHYASASLDSNSSENNNNRHNPIYSNESFDQPTAELNVINNAYFYDSTFKLDFDRYMIKSGSDDEVFASEQAAGVVLTSGETAVKVRTATADYNTAQNDPHGSLIHEHTSAFAETATKAITAAAVGQSNKVDRSIRNGEITAQLTANLVGAVTTVAATTAKSANMEIPSTTPTATSVAAEAVSEKVEEAKVRAANSIVAAPKAVAKELNLTSASVGEKVSEAAGIATTAASHVRTTATAAEAVLTSTSAIAATKIETTTTTVETKIDRKAATAATKLGTTAMTGLIATTDQMTKESDISREVRKSARPEIGTGSYVSSYTYYIGPAEQQALSYFDKLHDEFAEIEENSSNVSTLKAPERRSATALSSVGGQAIRDVVIGSGVAGEGGQVAGDGFIGSRVESDRKTVEDRPVILVTRF